MLPKPMQYDSNIGFRNLADTIISGENIIIPEEWRQGRTAYGGLTAGLCLAAAARDFSDLPPLRSIQITFVGPVPSNPVFKTKLLRRGRNVTTVEVHSLSQDGETNAAAICMFGAARESSISAYAPAPTLPDPDSCQSFLPPQAARFAPKFTLQFETKFIGGHRLMTGADEGHIRTWSRHLDPASRTGTDSFLTIGDVLPPAAATTFTKMGPISSMNWHMNILVDDVDSEDGWYQIESIQTAAQGGYSSQPMRFWNRKGDLIAEGLQSVAIFV